MTNKRFLLGMLVMVLAFGTMVLGCKSTPPLQPERTGPKSILEWAKSDGIYSLGDTMSIQFMGETWIQKNGDDPFCAGTITGMPPMPPELTSAFNSEQWEAFFNAVTAKEGDITLKVTMAYIGGKWQTIEELEKTLNNPIASKAVPQTIKDSVAEFKKGITIHYEFIAEPPFIALTKK